MSKLTPNQEHWLKRAQWRFKVAEWMRHTNNPKHDAWYEATWKALFCMVADLPQDEDTVS